MQQGVKNQLHSKVHALPPDESDGCTKLTHICDVTHDKLTYVTWQDKSAKTAPSAVHVYRACLGPDISGGYVPTPGRAWSI